MVLKWIDENITRPLMQVKYEIDLLKGAVSSETKKHEELHQDLIDSKESEIKYLISENARLNNDNYNLKEQLNCYQHISNEIEQINDSFESLTSLIENGLDDSKDFQIKWKENILELSSSTLENFKNIRNILMLLARNESDQKDLIECLNSICNGAYNADFIEFFALKTYRGWKYICHDGVSTTDFDDIDGVEVCWKPDDKVKVNYTYKEREDDLHGEA